MPARRFLIGGRVQGVGFRYYVIHHAERLALTGWTRNLPDGRVEVFACGEETALTDLASLLAQGPPAARVTNVETHESVMDEGVAGFSVKY